VTGGLTVIKRLTVIGNSFGVIIDRPILELLKIERDTPLEIRTDGEALIIRPADGRKHSRVRQVTERLMARHDETLRKLAR
jgi:antitoxin component of MazEF toxin-antitoxin module